MTAASTDHPGPLVGVGLEALLAALCDQAGLDPRGARLIKFTNNAVFRLARDPVVVRIAGSSTVRNRIHTVVRVARWLADHDAPAVRLLEGIDEPLDADGHLATLWHTVDATGLAPTGRDLAAILRRFHHLPPPTFDLPRWQPLAPVRERLAEADGVVCHDDLAFLRTSTDELEERLRDLEYVLPYGPIHGDAFLGNVIAGPHGPVICDFDSTSHGPREWDLTPVAVGKLRFAYPGNPHEQLAESYGLDITTWHGFTVLRQIRELELVTSVVPVLNSNPSLRDQWEHRLRTFRTGNSAAIWQTYA